MCGIFAYLGHKIALQRLREAALKLTPRGPDDFEFEEVAKEMRGFGGIVYGFARLAIMDVSTAGNQPFVSDDGRYVLMCNGEIYNFEALKEKYGFDYHSHSDCEVIMHMVAKFGVAQTCVELDGVFAFVISDLVEGKVYAARDPIGIRPSFIGTTADGEHFIASEMKTMTEFCENVVHFEPGCWVDMSEPTKFVRYISNEYPVDVALTSATEEIVIGRIRELLTWSVEKRIMSDRPIACLLSGGLDSSLITALVNTHYAEGTLNTFSIGMEGSTDLYHAKMVADHCKTNHHNIQLEISDFLNAIEEVIYSIESYDTTTVRASVGNYLVSKYISENSDCKVIFNGDGSEEIFGSYLYSANAPSAHEFYLDNKKLINEIYCYDVLRSDRSISSNGLEARTPFLDKALVSYVMSIPPEWKMHGNGKIEKHILRKAFAGSGLLPDKILWRKKEAFSDGVSSKEKSWFEIIQDFVEETISDGELEAAKSSYTHCPPQLKETLYYRRIFEKFFGNKVDEIVPHYWLPNFSGDIIDPSARVLSVYHE